MFVEITLLSVCTLSSIGFYFCYKNQIIKEEDFETCFNYVDLKITKLEQKINNFITNTFEQNQENFEQSNILEKTNIEEKQNISENTSPDSFPIDIEGLSDEEQFHLLYH